MLQELVGRINNGIYDEAKNLIEVIDATALINFVKDRYNALTAAVKMGQIDIVKLLLTKQPALIDKLNKNKKTILSSAVKNKHLEILTFLIEQKWELTNNIDAFGQTVLHTAIHRDIIEFIKLLLAYNPKLIDMTGKLEVLDHYNKSLPINAMSPLRESICWDKKELVSIFVSRGAALTNTEFMNNNRWIIREIITAGKIADQILKGATVKTEYLDKILTNSLMNKVFFNRVKFSLIKQITYEGKTFDKFKSLYFNNCATIPPQIAAKISNINPPGIFEKLEEGHVYIRELALSFKNSINTNEDGSIGLDYNKFALEPKHYSTLNYFYKTDNYSLKCLLGDLYEAGLDYKYLARQLSNVHYLALASIAKFNLQIVGELILPIEITLMIIRYLNDPRDHLKNISMQVMQH